MAAVAIAATMVSPAAMTAVTVLAPGSFVASAAEVKEIKVDMVVEGLDKDVKGSVKVEFTEKGNDKQKYVWDSVENKDKEFKLPTGKTYIVKVIGVPEGYKAEAKEAEMEIKADATAAKVTITATKDAGQKPGEGEQKPDPKPDTAVKRKLEVQHLDAETKKPLAGGKVEITETGKTGALFTIDFSQPNKNVVDLEVGKSYTVTFMENFAGYAHVKDKYDVTIEANKDGKVENQILVIESKKIADPKPEDPKAVEKLLDLQHIDKSTNKEIKSGEVTILEKGMDEEKAQKYDFSKDDNNVKVTNGKTYVIKFTKTANGYAPVAQEQELKVEFSPTDGADTYLAKVYSNPLTINQNGGIQNGGIQNGGVQNGGTTGGVQNGGTANNGSSTGLPQTGVATTTFGVALTGAIGSGLAMLRKRK